MIMDARKLNQPPANAAPQPQPKKALRSAPLLDRLSTSSQIPAEKIAEIRERWANGEAREKISSDFGLKPVYISYLCRGIRRPPSGNGSTAGRPKRGQSPEIQARNAEIRERWANGEAARQIATDYGLAPAYVSCICNGVERKNTPEYGSTPEIQARNAEIRGRYVNGWRREELARWYHLSLRTIARICDKTQREIKPKNMPHSSGRRGARPSPEVQARNAEIRQRYANGEIGANLAREYGISRQRVFQICDGLKKDKRIHLSPAKIKKRNAKIHARWANGETNSEIAADYALRPATVSNICKGVKRKLKSKPATREPSPERQARDAVIRERWGAGIEPGLLAKVFDLHEGTIRHICKGVERKAKPERKKYTWHDPFRQKEARNAEMRQRYANGESGLKLARDYGMTKQNVSLICKGVERKR